MLAIQYTFPFEYLLCQCTVDTHYCVSIRLKDKGIPSDIVKKKKSASVCHNKESFFHLQSFSQLIFARACPDGTHRGKKGHTSGKFLGIFAEYRQAFLLVYYNHRRGGQANLAH